VRLGVPRPRNGCCVVSIRVSTLLGQMVGYALATVVSPIVFIGMFLMLTTNKPVRNGWVYLAGLLAAVAVVAVFAAFVLHNHVQEAGSEDSISWFGVLMGLFELGLGVYLKFWGQPPGQVELPAFASRLQTIKPFTVFAIGCFVPTFPAAISAGIALIGSDQASSGRVSAVVVYLLLCAIVVAVPLVFVQIRGEQAQVKVRSALDWVLQRSSTWGAWILILVGIYLILQALPPIT
jgi:Sap, sulfolipid-1-addressing protein